MADDSPRQWHGQQLKRFKSKADRFDITIFKSTDANLHPRANRLANQHHWYPKNTTPAPKPAFQQPQTTTINTMSFLLSLLHSKLNPPSNPTTSFSNRTILVTGANSGLGFEAAQKFISLGAETVFLACRSISKGEAARSEICARTGCEQDRMRVMELDMSSWGSIREFVRSLREEVGDKGLDVALLNAGVVQFSHQMSDEGWEQTLQVNVLGSTLLGISLLSLLSPTSSTSSGPGARKKNLTFVSSGNYQFANIPPQALSSPSLLRYFDKKENFAGPEEQYSVSKLFLMYAVNELAATVDGSEVESSEKVVRSRGKNEKENQVVINSVNPGATATNLTRNITGIILRIVAYVYLNLLARTAEQGSRSLVSACALGRESQGQLWQDDVLVK
ncbi:MAG: hypothetical protein Q9215_006059 [Flavoplaca cf. flavocitrina]